MQLVSVNIGKERICEVSKVTGSTGIYKTPTDAAVTVTAEGIAGDVVTDKVNHGGVDQAVYVYGTPDYKWWSNELGKELAAGTFGENLTISELESAVLNIGDMLRVGEVLLQVTAPRIPCQVLAWRMDDTKFVKQFRFGGRPGVYCRVLEVGRVRVGDMVQREPFQGESYSVDEMFRAWFEKDVSEADLRRQLAAPIAIRPRKVVEERLAKLLAEAEKQN